MNLRKDRDMWWILGVGGLFLIIATVAHALVGAWHHRKPISLWHYILLIISWLAMMIAIITAPKAKDDQPPMEQQSQECMDRGGIPDIHGRYSDEFTCHVRNGDG